MKIILWCLLLLAQQGWAQTTETAINDDQITNASGNPYLFKDWMDGVVLFKSGRLVKQFKLRFDCARNRLMLQFEGAAFAAESQVKEFVLYTRKNKDSLLFRKGYPAIGKNTEDTYYQVLVSGKAVLLRLYTKVLIEEKQMVNTNNHSRLEDEEYFYLLQDGVMTNLPRDKEELLKKLPAQPDELKQFVAQQSLRMDKAEDFVKIITKYNELVPQN
ncbi:hypothetical protein D3H65_03350 [Paraflavitalea soli]|uniref:DUF4369 domain-containing protein n=1 Tax=Paraflavitalea soli TaxID=2315862 RepID=A0A3B7MFF8_9BACT|nr:hypothetical protein [Paraflavitalea soli]AXY73062.1 hypothetical protein D3H65_03350 [Paraflavitalea soli]